MKVFLMIFCICFFSLFSDEVKQDNGMDIEKISEAVGFLIGKNLKSMGVPLDLNLIIKGIENANTEKNAPMSEGECYEVINAIQESSFLELAERNLKTAEDFLKTNAQNLDIEEIEEGKLQIKIEKIGTGNEVKPYDSPLVQYKGYYLDGTIFGSSSEPELISLDETIDGFRKALTGMKEGEKRTVYIHPDLGYGKKGFLLPNSLLIFEVEVIQCDTTASKILEEFPREISGSLDENHILR